MERSLPRAAYWDTGFYQREQEAIFRRAWVLVGRAEQFARTGDYRVFEVADESVIVIRAADGALHAHLNFCRHRGSRLLCGEGTVRGAIRCPYHAWAYGADGALMSAPFVAPGDVPDEAKRLHGVEIERWGGFVFVRLAAQSDGAGESLREQIGAVAQRLVRYPLDELRVVRSLRYDVAANWKVVLENFNECYHCAGVHPELCRIVPAFKQRGGAGLDWENGIPHRAGATTFTASGTTARAPFPGLDEFESTRHKGELLYPNFMLSLCADHVAAFTVSPREPAATTIVCDMLFHPSEIEKAAFDPADAIDFWDLVNRQDWRICEEVQAGMRSRSFRYGYYSPMEDSSLDIRRYLAQRMGVDG